ncbi:hypothetical protein HK101_011262 [Irineochytrium annulatum]|nr:hypothetical protein HK101_011262 [Irineochytrium annulatum]
MSTLRSRKSRGPHAEAEKHRNDATDDDDDAPADPTPRTWPTIPEPTEDELNQLQEPEGWSRAVLPVMSIFLLALLALVVGLVAKEVLRYQREQALLDYKSPFMEKARALPKKGSGAA